MRVLFVTSCGTDTGKTFITTALCWHFKRIGASVQAIKPVVSGWNAAGTENDTCRILRSLGHNITPGNIASVSPWRLEYPHAPNIAGKKEGIKLCYKEILAFCRAKLAEESDYLLVEGAGGVMSPITDDKTCLDLIKDLGADALLVTGPYLGSISHTLTALHTLGEMCNGVILTLKNGNEPHFQDIADYISSYCGKRVYIQPRVEPEGDATDLWTLTSAGVADFVNSTWEEVSAPP